MSHLDSSRDLQSSFWTQWRFFIFEPHSQDATHDEYHKTNQGVAPDAIRKPVIHRNDLKLDDQQMNVLIKSG